MCSISCTPQPLWSLVVVRDIVSIYDVYVLQQSEYFYYFDLTQYMQFGIELIILTILTSPLSLVLHFSEMKQS